MRMGSRAAYERHALWSKPYSSVLARYGVRRPGRQGGVQPLGHHTFVPKFVAHVDHHFAIARTPAVGRPGPRHQV
jgi:hypothetical protein